MLLNRCAFVTLLLSGVPTRAVAGSDFTATATLSATNEVPPTGSPATGFATIKYLSSLDELTYDVTYSGLSASATAGHLHFSRAGRNGPVILPLLPAPSGTSGEITGTLTDADIVSSATTGITTIAQVAAQIAAGNVYADIHTIEFPGGEIRGQLQVQTAVPEPASLTLAAVCLGGMALRAWRKRRVG